MQSHSSSAALHVGRALLAVCVVAALGRCVQPRAIPAAYEIDAPATHSTRRLGSAPPRDFIGEVRIGHGIDVLGKVPPSFAASRFAAGDPIHLSMWEVSKSPAGSLVRVSVVDVADRIVWSEDKAVLHGGSYLSFGIGRTLARGKYRADVIVGQEVRSRTGFEVFERKIR